MKPKFKLLISNVILFLFFLSNQSSFAQESLIKNNSRFDQAVDYFNYRIIDYDLKDNKEKSYSDFQKLGKNLSSEKLKEFLGNKSNNLGDYSKLHEEINGLKKYYEKDIKEQKELFSKKVFTTVFKEINKFENERINKAGYQTFKKQLDKEMMKRLNEVVQHKSLTSVMKVSQPKPPTPNKNNKTKVPSKNWLKKSISHLIAFFSGIILTLLYLFLFKKNKKRHEINHSENMIDKATKPLIKVQNEGDDKEKEKVKINLDETHPPESVSSMEDEHISQPIELDIENHTSILTIEPEPNNVLYFPNPFEENAFLKSDGRPSLILGASIFKFYLKSDKEAEFEFLNEKPSVNIAINSRFDIILAVSDELNSFNQQATKIITQANERGKVTLEGNVWKVTRKVKIKYV